MTDFDGILTIFIAHPLLAAVPAVVFTTAHLIRPRRPALVAGLAWGAYAVWELVVKRRHVCDAACNIRVDLLLIYPALAVASIAAIVALIRNHSES